MENMHISRRKLLVTGASALAGTWLTGCSKPLPSSVLSVLGAGDALHLCRASHAAAAGSGSRVQPRHDLADAAQRHDQPSGRQLSTIAQGQLRGVASADRRSRGATDCRVACRPSEPSLAHANHATHLRRRLVGDRRMDRCATQSRSGSGWPQARSTLPRFPDH